jgi:hypothetical protein
MTGNLSLLPVSATSIGILVTDMYGMISSTT